MSSCTSIRARGSTCRSWRNTPRRPISSVRTASTCATRTRAGRCCRPRYRPCRSLRQRRHPSRDGGGLHRRRRRSRPGRRDDNAPGRGGAPRFRRARRACAGLFAGMGERDLRRGAGEDPRGCRRISQSRPGRRDDRDRRRHFAVPSGRHHVRQDGEQRLGRIRVLLGAHPAGLPGGRAGCAGRNARDDGAAEPTGRKSLVERQAGPWTGSWTIR